MRYLILFTLFLTMTAVAGDLTVTFSDPDSDPIVLTIEEANVVKFVSAFAAAYSYQPTIDGQPNPETAKQHAIRRIIEYVQQVEDAARTKAAVEAARTAEKAKPKVPITEQ